LSEHYIYVQESRLSGAVICGALDSKYCIFALNLAIHGQVTIY